MSTSYTNYILKLAIGFGNIFFQSQGKNRSHSLSYAEYF